jgi:hypothetical protein
MKNTLFSLFLKAFIDKGNGMYKIKKKEKKENFSRAFVLKIQTLAMGKMYKYLPYQSIMR